MIIVQEKQKEKKLFGKSLWTDIYFKSEEEAKDYIKEKVVRGKSIEDFRVVSNYYKCRINIEFIAAGKEKPATERPGSVPPPPLTPLYELSRLIRQAEAELEEMRKNPEIGQDEIAEIERELARHKAEFEARKAKLRR